jgi:asparagine synthase (glutamine-hydrolysing)
LPDHTYVDWVSGLPPGLKLRQGRAYILKKALAALPRTPHRRKMGFAVPLAPAARTTAPARARAAARAASARRALPPAAVERPRQHETCADDAVLWALLMLDASLSRLGVA